MKLEPFEVEVVRVYVVRHGVACACGARAFAPEEGMMFRCHGCGVFFERRAGGW